MPLLYATVLAKGIASTTRQHFPDLAGPAQAPTHASFCSSIFCGSVSFSFFLKACLTWSRSSLRLPPCRRPG